MRFFEERLSRVNNANGGFVKRGMVSKARFWVAVSWHLTVAMFSREVR